MPNLVEGIYKGEIKKVNFLNDQKTDYGFRDVLEVTYSLLVGVTEQLKIEKILVSQAENSRCFKFLLDFYKGDIPKEIDINDFINKKCVVTVKHNTGKDGNINDKIRM